MDGKALEALQECEDLVRSGGVKTFSVRLLEERLLIEKDGESEAQEVALPEELYDSLKIFFYNVESIPYRSYDYSTLRSLINAHMCLERMKKNSPQ